MRLPATKKLSNPEERDYNWGRGNSLPQFKSAAKISWESQSGAARFRCLEVLVVVDPEKFRPG